MQTALALRQAIWRKSEPASQLRTSRAATGTSSAWRVSTDGQDAQLQRDDLRAAGCGRIYQEKASTRKATADRPGLSATLDYLRAGDTLVVWKLDRLGRSVKDVLTIADDLQERGAGVRILTGNQA